MAHKQSNTGGRIGELLGEERFERAARVGLDLLPL